MVKYKSYNFSLKEVSAIVGDTYGAEYFWVAFKQNASGDCLLRKVSAHDLEQVYYEFELEVSEIKGLSIISSVLMAVFDDSTNIAKIYTVTNPITNNTEIALPAGINEAPLEVINDGSYFYIMFPGSVSGENCKILKYNTNGTLIETIDLTGITNIKSFTIDSNSEFWLVTYDSPSDLIRVYEASGGIYTTDTTQLG